MAGTTSFFGELYLRTTRPYLTEDQTLEECAYLRGALSKLPVAGPILDLGCGHGRHLSPLVVDAPRPMFGVDFDQLSLRDAVQAAAVARGDFFALPFRSGHFAAVFAWYSALFTFDDAQQVPLFREAARVLRPGGRLLFQHVPLEHARQRAQSSHDEVLGTGMRVVDGVAFDAASRRDKGVRKLIDPDGRALEAPYEIRYYPLVELEDLLRSAGLKVLFVHGAADGRPLSPSSVELIVGAERG